MPKFQVLIVPVTPFQQNCTVIWDADTGTGAVVDPGGDVDEITKMVKQTGMTLEKIVLTHGHIDHAGGATALREKFGVEIHGPHLADKFLLDTLEDQALELGMAGVRNVEPDHWLDEGDEIEMAKVSFSILHCPGHSPGSLVFARPDLNFALVGDVIFKGSIGRTDFPYGDHEALINAIHTKLLPLGDEVQFICGHGAASTLGDERKSNPFLQTS